MVAEQPIDDTARALANAVRGDVRFGRHDRLLYATDASIYQVEPLGVVVPESVEDAVAAVRFCAEHGLPMLPRGGGTSLAGQCVNRAVVLDLSAGCRGILVIDEGGRRARVEAGRTIDDLNDELRAGGLFFAPDPSTARQATVGGCIGNNAAGSRSVLYGRTAENLLGVDVALADGRRVTLDEGAALRDPTVADLTERVCGIVRSNELLIRERFPNTVRRNAGYALDMILAQLDSGAGSYEKVNLAHLICGSEGTLAVTLGAELKLVPIPAARGLAVLSFDSLDAAIAAVVPLLELNPSAIELLDDLVVGLARENLQHRGSLELLPEPPGGRTEAVLYVELSVEDAGELPGLFEGVRARAGGASIATSTDAPGMARLWALRKAGEPLLHGVPGERKPLGFIEDNAVPPERLSEFVRRLRQIIESRGTRGAFYAHASVGVLHVR
ncbi:MAG: FAD-binding oxidoreductase, partial [Planctomycetota bacterium]